MKKMTAVIGAILILGVSALAADYPEYVQTCKSLGMEKLREEAHQKNYVLKEDTFGYCAIDNRWYNPSKYVLYCAEATDQDGAVVEVNRIVQYSRGECY